MSRWNKSQQGRWSKPAEGDEPKQSPEDRAYDQFADMMIKRIEEVSADWKKPWVSKNHAVMPRPLVGRPYNGMNALMLMMVSQMKGYSLPIYVTSNKVNSLNYDNDAPKTSRGTSPRILGDDGEPLPMVHIIKGEKAFPVILSLPRYVNQETNERLNAKEYDALSESEQSKYRKCFVKQVYSVFNIDQTNLKEARPEMYQKLLDKFIPEVKEKDPEQMFAFEPIDRMIKDNIWICPIKPVEGDEAYYSIGRKEIVIPEKKQFNDGESFYSNLLHEMTHSTGAEGVLDRLKPASFGSKDYAREELVAELTAALVSSSHGMEKGLKEDSASYLKNWLNSLKEDPSFIKTVLTDVKAAAKMIEGRIDLAINIKEREDNGEKVDLSQYQPKSKEDAPKQPEESQPLEEEKASVSPEDKKVAGMDVDGDGEIEGNEVMEEHDTTERQQVHFRR